MQHVQMKLSDLMNQQVLAAPECSPGLSGIVPRPKCHLVSGEKHCFAVSLCTALAKPFQERVHDKVAKMRK